MEPALLTLLLRASVQKCLENIVTCRWSAYAVIELHNVRTAQAATEFFLLIFS